MNKVRLLIWMALTGSMAISADSFAPLDSITASKDSPFPPDESNLPENTPSDDADEKEENSGNAQILPKGVYSDPNSNQPRAGKDIFPPDND